MQHTTAGKSEEVLIDFGRPVRFAETLFAQEIDGELIVLDLRDESYYGLDAVGAEIWRRLREGKSPEMLCRDLSEYYEVDEETIRRDLERFLRQLFGQKLAWQESEGEEGPLTSPE